MSSSKQQSSKQSSPPPAASLQPPPLQFQEKTALRTEPIPSRRNHNERKEEEDTNQNEDGTVGGEHTIKDQKRKRKHKTRENKNVHSNGGSIGRMMTRGSSFASTSEGTTSSPRRHRRPRFTTTSSPSSSLSVSPMHQLRQLIRGGYRQGLDALLFEPPPTLPSRPNPQQQQQQHTTTTTPAQPAPKKKKKNSKRRQHQQQQQQQVALTTTGTESGTTSSNGTSVTAAVASLSSGKRRKTTAMVPHHPHNSKNPHPPTERSMDQPPPPPSRSTRSAQETAAAKFRAEVFDRKRETENNTRSPVLLSSASASCSSSSSSSSRPSSSLPLPTTKRGRSSTGILDSHTIKTQRIKRRTGHNTPSSTTVPTAAAATATADANATATATADDTEKEVLTVAAVATITITTTTVQGNTGMESNNIETKKTKLAENSTSTTTTINSNDTTTTINSNDTTTTTTATTNQNNSTNEQDRILCDVDDDADADADDAPFILDEETQNHSYCDDAGIRGIWNDEGTERLPWGYFCNSNTTTSSSSRNTVVGTICRNKLNSQERLDDGYVTLSNLLLPSCHSVIVTTYDSGCMANETVRFLRDSWCVHHTNTNTNTNHNTHNKNTEVSAAATATTMSSARRTLLPPRVIIIGHGDYHGSAFCNIPSKFLNNDDDDTASPLSTAAVVAAIQSKAKSSTDSSAAAAAAATQLPMSDIFPEQESTNFMEFPSQPPDQPPPVILPPSKIKSTSTSVPEDEHMEWYWMAARPFGKWNNLQHSKVLLFRSNEGLRVVISGNNLTEHQWTEDRDIMWIMDIPISNVVDLTADSVGNHSRTSSSLLVTPKGGEYERYSDNDERYSDDDPPLYRLRYFLIDLMRSSPAFHGISTILDKDLTRFVNLRVCALFDGLCENHPINCPNGINNSGQRCLFRFVYSFPRLYRRGGWQQLAGIVRVLQEQQQQQEQPQGDDTTKENCIQRYDDDSFYDTDDGYDDNQKDSTNSISRAIELEENIHLYAMSGSFGDLKPDFLRQMRLAFCGLNLHTGSNNGCANNSINCFNNDGHDRFQKWIVDSTSKNIDWSSIQKTYCLWPSQHMVTTMNPIGVCGRGRPMSWKHWNTIPKKSRRKFFFDAVPNPYEPALVCSTASQLACNGGIAKSKIIKLNEGEYKLSAGLKERYHAFTHGKAMVASNMMIPCRNNTSKTIYRDKVEKIFEKTGNGSTISSTDGDTQKQQYTALYVGSHNFSKKAWGIRRAQPGNIEFGVVLFTTSIDEAEQWRSRLPYRMPIPGENSDGYVPGRNHNVFKKVSTAAAHNDEIY